MVLIAIDEFYKSPYITDVAPESIWRILKAVPIANFPSVIVLLLIQLFKKFDVLHVFTPPDDIRKLSGVDPFICEIEIFPVNVFELHYKPEAVVYFNIY